MRVTIARAALLGTVAAAAPLPRPAAGANRRANHCAGSAATSPQPHATAATNPEGSGTGDIVVTARRTEELLQHVPAAVSAFNERALDRIQAQDPTGLQGAVPNLNIVQGRGSSNATNIYHPRHRPAGRAADLRSFGRRLCRRRLLSAASAAPSSTCSTSSGSRCCAGRRARSTARTRSAARSTSSPAGRATTFRADVSRRRSAITEFDVRGAVSGPVDRQRRDRHRGAPLDQHDGYVQDPVLNRDYNDKNTVRRSRGAIALTPVDNVRIDLSARL